VIVIGDVLAAKNKNHNVLFQKEDNDLYGEKSKIDKNLETRLCKLMVLLIFQIGGGIGIMKSTSLY